MLWAVAALLIFGGRADAKQDAAAIYERNCAKCHGPAGQPPAPPEEGRRLAYDFSNCSVSSAEPDAPWRLAVTHGGRAVGLSKDMPSFSDKLNDAEIAAVVRYVRGLCVSQGWPNGNLNFSRPIVTEKAFPEDEVVLRPSHTRGKGEPSETELEVVFEKRFGKRNNVEIEFPFASFPNGDGRVTGLQDLKAAVKRVFLSDREGTRIVSGGFEVAFPSANTANGLGEGRYRYEPFVAAGLSRGLTTLQTQFAVEFEKVTEGSSSEIEREYSYNIFAGRDLSTRPTRWSLGVELNGVNKDLALTPQIRKGLVRTGALAAALGAQIPINHRDERRSRIVAYLLWDYREPVWRRARR